MRRSVESVRREVRKAKRAGRRQVAEAPVYSLPDYVSTVLGATLTDSQALVCRLLRTPPYKVLVRSGNALGKSFLAAAVANWWHDTFRPGVVLTTAPTDRQVRSILWKEIRRQRRGRPTRPTTILPKACWMGTAEDHFALGFTAKSVDAFQGHHEAANLAIFDEAEGIDPAFFDAAETMMHGVYAWLLIYNPLSQSGPTVEAERSGQFHVVTMSALDHPNITEELAGREAPYPRAVRLDRVREMMAKWSRRCTSDEPGAVKLGEEWWIPGPMAEARILGRRPSAGFRSVWPKWVFEQCLTAYAPMRGTVQIGFDVGEMGDDPSAFCVRQGGNVLWLEEFHGPKDYTVGEKAGQRALQLAHDWGTTLGVDEKRIPIVVDTGGGYGTVPLLYLRQLGYWAIPSRGAEKAQDEEQFPNLRTELWVYFSRVAAAGQLSLANLPMRQQEMLRTELTATEYGINLRGQMQVERKTEIKKRIGRSTDCADAFLLSLADVNILGDREMGRVEAP